MRKILISAGMIAFVAAVAIGGTGAFFSDSETSTGNTFTAGAIDLKVDSHCLYFQNGQNVGCEGFGNWSLTDLGPSLQFFNFGDIKPGDYGENTISLHIDNNPAWLCADIGTNSNSENDRISPEVIAGDTTDGVLGGELAQNINLFAWLDDASTNGATPGDNIWQAGETVLVQPVSLLGLTTTTTLPIADSVVNGGQPLPGGTTNYIGLGWCAGTLNIGVPGSWSCDGAGMGNVAQTDSASSTIQFRVEQSRNNANFVCSQSEIPQIPNPTP